MQVIENKLTMNKGCDTASRNPNKIQTAGEEAKTITKGYNLCLLNIDETTPGLWIDSMGT